MHTAVIKKKEKNEKLKQKTQNRNRTKSRDLPHTQPILYTAIERLNYNYQTGKKPSYQLGEEKPKKQQDKTTSAAAHQIKK